MELVDIFVFSMVLAIVIALGILPKYLVFLDDRRIRERLRQTVPRYRLYKMLAYLGADYERYIKRLPTEDITRHVLNCNACPNLDVCDSCLRDGHEQKDMDFCPNYKSLTVCSKLLRD